MRRVCGSHLCLFTRHNGQHLSGSCDDTFLSLVIRIEVVDEIFQLILGPSCDRADPIADLPVILRTVQANQTPDQMLEQLLVVGIPLSHVSEGIVTADDALGVGAEAVWARWKE